MTQMTLALVMMVGIAVVFGTLHLLLRRVPFDEMTPRERWRWPVWSWYPLVLGFGLLFAFGAQIYWLNRVDGNGRAPEDVMPEDIQPVRGEEERTGGGRESPTPEKDDGKASIAPEHPRKLAQADVPVSGDAAAATPVGTPAHANPVGEGGPSWAEPGGTPIPDPFASPVPTSSPVATGTAMPSPSPSPSPSTSPR